MNRILALALLPVLTLAACDKPAATTTTSSTSSSATSPAAAATSILPASLFLTTAPADAKEVKAAKADAKVGDTITLHGRIGGSVNPFVDSRAVFTLMDMALPACNDNPDDHCTTPWDYCCETKSDIAANAATIQVTGADGLPLKTGLKGAGNLKELDELIVVGKVTQAEAGKVLVVKADGIYRKVN